jgi:hypothetical protein
MRRLLAPLIVSLGLVLSPAALGAPDAPPSFFGLQAWSHPTHREFVAMERARAGLVRFGLTWSQVEPVPGARRWTEYDRLFASAARAGMLTLPVLSGSPSFAAARETYPPLSRSARTAFASFVRDAVARYGPHGTFWADNPDLPYRPVRTWQIWNEPNFHSYWHGKPNAREYVALVRLSRRAIREVDPTGRVLLAGVAETRLGIRSTTFLKQVYRVPGARRQFDAVAIHPYAYDDEWVLAAVRRARRVMNNNGDRRAQLWITEVGWATGGPVSRATSAIRKSQLGQARLLTRTYRALIRHRRRLGLASIVWFALRDREPAKGEGDWWGVHTGLIDVAGVPKPSWSAFARVAGGRP